MQLMKRYLLNSITNSFQIVGAKYLKGFLPFIYCIKRRNLEVISVPQIVRKSILLVIKNTFESSSCTLYMSIAADKGHENTNLFNKIPNKMFTFKHFKFLSHIFLIL